MIVRHHRCQHCQSPYQYHASGNWMPKFNNKDYCPSCWEKISALLETIPVVRKEVWLPCDLTPAEFDAKMRAEKDRQADMAERDGKPNIFMGDFCHQILGFGTGMTALHLTVDYFEYRKVHASHTKEELVELRYELDVPSGEIVGLWGWERHNKLTKEQWVQLEREATEWRKENHAPPLQVKFEWPMEAPKDSVLYARPYSAHDTLVEYAQAEMKKELK